MKHAEKIDLAKKAGEKFAHEKNTANFPAQYWMFYINIQSGVSAISIPSSGTLWVYYAYNANPPVFIEVWHQGGTVTPLIANQDNNVPVGAGDMIYYQLAAPATDSMKIAYQYV